MLAGQLDKAGLPRAFAGAAAGLVGGVAVVVGARGAARRLSLLRTTRSRASSAHVTAMFPAFFAVAIGLGAPPLLAALTFGFFSSLNAATTHYGTGPAPIVFGAGYLTQAEWWRDRVPDLAGAPRDLAADRLSVVEGDRLVVMTVD